MCSLNCHYAHIECVHYSVTMLTQNVFTMLSLYSTQNVFTILSLYSTQNVFTILSLCSQRMCSLFYRYAPHRMCSLFCHYAHTECVHYSVTIPHTEFYHCTPHIMCLLYSVNTQNVFIITAVENTCCIENHIKAIILTFQSAPWIKVSSLSI